MTKPMRKLGPSAHIVKVEVGPYKEMTAMRREVFDQVRRLVDLGGTYTLSHILELGIEEASKRQQEDDENEYNDSIDQYY